MTIAGSRARNGVSSKVIYLAGGIATVPWSSRVLTENHGGVMSAGARTTALDVLHAAASVPMCKQWGEHIVVAKFT